ncbi:MAG: hypothetical protein V1703_00075, partial [Candidatus Altiarchaeota archaeon]
MLRDKKVVVEPVSRPPGPVSRPPVLPEEHKIETTEPVEKGTIRVKTDSKPESKPKVVEVLFPSDLQHVKEVKFTTRGIGKADFGPTDYTVIPLGGAKSRVTVENTFEAEIPSIIVDRGCEITTWQPHAKGFGVETVTSLELNLGGRRTPATSLVPSELKPGKEAIFKTKDRSGECFEYTVGPGKGGKLSLAKRYSYDAYLGKIAEGLGVDLRRAT